MLEVRDLGFGVGLHTAGAYPRRLAEVLALVDWIGLDIKALPSVYTAVTGVKASAVKAYESLRLVLDNGVDHEVQITVDPTVRSTEHVETLVRRLRETGVQQIVLQQARLGTRASDRSVTVVDFRGRLPEGVSLRGA